ncbi:MAG: alpha/beta hydrolase [Bacillaceae bacterium]|nr:carboxylesterase [Bacillaceae bacterium]
MKHFYRRGKRDGSPVLLLLHGTGGNECDLLPLANILDPEAGVLGVRGEVSENGMARFFRRIREGVFDVEDLVFRTRRLAEFLDSAAEQYAFDRKRVIAVGYSNGANMAASLLFHIPGSLKGALLFHPMVPRRGIPLPDLSGTKVWIAAGEADPICPKEEAEELESLLRDAGSDVTVHWEKGGHSIKKSEVEQARQWYQKHF